VFTPSYQIRLLSYLCIDTKYALGVISYLSINIFSTSITRALFLIISNYYSTYKSTPTIAVVEQELLTTNIIPADEPFVQQFIEAVNSGSISEAEYIKSTLKQFIASQTLKSTLGTNADVIDLGDFSSLVQRLRVDETNLNILDDNAVCDTFSLHNLKELYLLQGGMKSGIPLIDNNIGGIMKKELTMLLADTNVGKSMAMVAIGGCLVRGGYRVLHVSLEMSKARTLIRYFATLIESSDNMGYTSILGFNPAEAVFNYVHKLHDKYEGLLFVEELPTGRGTIGNLYTLIDRYAPIDVIIVDYLDLLAPLSKRDARRFELADLSVGLRGISSEKDIAVLSATQTSRQASGKRIVGKEMVAEDYEKVRVCDTVISMGQSKDDELKQEVIFFIAKSRNTEKNKADRYKMNFENMSFTLIRQEFLEEYDRAEHYDKPVYGKK
jgi:replicative DNA helicase